MLRGSKYFSSVCYTGHLRLLFGKGAPQQPLLLTERPVGGVSEESLEDFLRMEISAFLELL